MTETLSRARCRAPETSGLPDTRSAPRPRFVLRDDIVSWGRVDRRAQLWARPAFRDELDALVADPVSREKLGVGLRRSYGDSCLNFGGALIDATRLGRLIPFDHVEG